MAKWSRPKRQKQGFFKRLSSKKKNQYFKNEVFKNLRKNKKEGQQDG